MVSNGRTSSQWRKTDKMNMRDLSRDDDFLSSMLIESLGTDDSPLLVHKMDTGTAVPSHDPAELLEIVRKHIVYAKRTKASGNRVRHAVDALLKVDAVKEYLKGKSEYQRNAFATHASRYFELYMPHGSVEITRTTRYSHKTGKAELCIIATRPLALGEVIYDLTGSLADLTHEEDEQLRRKDHATGRKDFSVIYSRHKKLSHLFLGPARFVNHDCEHNVVLFRAGRYITFRVIKPIAEGQELTAHYGNSYFGRKNKDCLCETCERKGIGGYAPRVEGAEPDVSDSDISEASEIDKSARFWDVGEQEGKANLHERRTRRGTYHVDAAHAKATRTLSVPVTGNPAIEPAAAVVQSLDPVAVAQSLDAVAAERAAASSAAPTPSTLVNPSTTPETTISTLSSLSELDGGDVDMSETITRAPSPSPILPPIESLIPRPPTPSLPAPILASPLPFTPVDIDSYKPHALTAHFPTLVRIKDTEHIARIMLRRKDLGHNMVKTGLPPPSFHPLLESAVERGHYPKSTARKAPTHFFVSPAMVDPKMTSFDFFDCGAIQWPHSLVKLTDKEHITTLVLARGDLSRRSDWRGLPWPEWSPRLVEAQKAGNYPKFPPVEKRGDQPVFHASLALVGPDVGAVEPLEAPLPVGWDIPSQQLTFITEYEWAHIRVHPLLYGFDHSSCWEGLPWPETNLPLLDNLYRSKKWPVFPEIDDRGAPPIMRADRTYGIFESRTPRLMSNMTFEHTTDGYTKAGADPLPAMYKISRDKWMRILEQPDEFGLKTISDWRGLPWPELSTTLIDAQRRGTYPSFPPQHLRGAQPRSQGDTFTVFDVVFKPVPKQTAKVRENSASSRASSETPLAGGTPRGAAGSGSGSPSPVKRKGKDKDSTTLAKHPRDDGKPRCRTCWLLHPGPGDCARCRRHLIIYGSPWPRREPPVGARLRSPSPSPEPTSASESASDSEESDSDDDEDEDEEGEPVAPPPKKKQLQQQKKRAAAGPPSSSQPPLKRRKTEPQYAASRAERAAARAATTAAENAEHADGEGNARTARFHAMRRALQRQHLHRHQQLLMERRREEAQLPKPRLAGLPTPSGLSRRRSDALREAENRALGVADDDQDRRLRAEADGRDADRLSYGGLSGGPRNPMFFNQQHGNWRRRWEARAQRDARTGSGDESDDDDADLVYGGRSLHKMKMDIRVEMRYSPPRTPSPSLGRPMSPSSSQQTLDQPMSPHLENVMALMRHDSGAPLRSFHIPIPPWMDDAPAGMVNDELGPGFLVHVHS